MGWEGEQEVKFSALLVRKQKVGNALILTGCEMLPCLSLPFLLGLPLLLCTGVREHPRGAGAAVFMTNKNREADSYLKTG